MATGNKREVSWCFMPSQPERFYRGLDRVRDILYKKRAVMQKNTGERLFRQRSAARKELKTGASWGEFLE